MLMVEHGTDPKVVFAHAEGLLYVPQLMVGPHNLTSTHERGRNIGDVAFQPRELFGPIEGLWLALNKIVFGVCCW